MKRKIALVSVSAAVIPVFAFAATQTLSTLIALIIGYLNQALVLLIGLAVVTFAWYVFKYFIKPNENRDEAGKYVMYSLIGFFVMLSLWGLVNILQNTFGLGNASNAPQSWTDLSHLFPGGSSSSNNNFNATAAPTP